VQLARVAVSSCSSAQDYTALKCVPVATERRTTAHKERQVSTKLL